MTDLQPTETIAKPVDTPIAPPTFPPPSLSTKVKGFVGDLARPFAIYVTSGGAATATVIFAVRVAKDKIDLSSAAIFMGAVFTGVGALYVGKAWENAKIAATPSPNGTQ